MVNLSNLTHLRIIYGILAEERDFRTVVLRLGPEACHLRIVPNLRKNKYQTKPEQFMGIKVQRHGSDSALEEGVFLLPNPTSADPKVFENHIPGFHCLI
jgi:hypothetical protein